MARRIPSSASQALLGGRPGPDRSLRRDLKILARFIEVYCGAHHKEADKARVCLPKLKVEALIGRSVSVCAPCRKLLAHSFVKRILCPLDPKPECRRCPEHCYPPGYRRRIREVMKYSGRRLVLRGRLDYLWHLLS